MSSTATTTATVAHVSSDPAALSKLKLRGQSPTSAETTSRNTSSTAVPAEDYPYTEFLPSYDANFKLAPLEPFEHVDPGLAALGDANPREFLQGATERVLSPKFGSEIEGIQLSKLDTKAKG
jgi:sulfonate dioxygenase